MIEINQTSLTALCCSRAEKLNTATSSDPFDFIVVGGGIHGAQFARFAALLGSRVLLLERSDYASETSSRSTKLAHGGLRYLELFDFKQVFEGIQAREELFELALHLAHPYPFLVPVNERDCWFRLKLGVGLHLYDWMVKRADRKHRWIPRREFTDQFRFSKSAKLMGCFQYTDGIMDDARLVIECIQDARLAGATCLNYAEVEHVDQCSEGKECVVRWRDRLNGGQYSAKASVVVNCAGPWVEKFVRSSSPSPSNRFSRGAHILFNVPWKEPALFLPLAERGRYYFVLPHPTGTMVGTTEREVSDPSFDPLPSSDEISEIFERLKRDLPESGLNENTAHYCFAGIRTLPLRHNPRKKSSELSRYHLWNWDGALLSLYGGKYTTAAWTALEGLELACQKIGRAKPERALRGRKFGSTFESVEEKEKTRAELLQAGFKVGQVERLLSRLGRFSKELVNEKFSRATLIGEVTLGEIQYVVAAEQCCGVGDVLSRRVGMEYFPEHGLDIVDDVERVLSESLDSIAVKNTGDLYRARVAEARQLLGAR